MQVAPVDLLLTELIARAVAIFGKKSDARRDEGKQRDNQFFQFAPQGILFIRAYTS